MDQESGFLLHGVKVGDIVHRDFTVMLPVLRHTVAALSETMDALGTTDTPAAMQYYRVAVIKQALAKLGTLSQQEISTDMLMDGLTDEDFDLIDAQIGSLKKKRMLASPNLADSARPSSPSDDTA